MILCLAFANAVAHPLGNFTINHFARLEVDQTRIQVHYVIDMAEIATFQALQELPRNPDGTVSSGTLNAYLDRVVPQYAAGLNLSVDEARVPLEAVKKTISLTQGSGGLATLRVEIDFQGPVTGDVEIRRFHFEDTNHRERIGWHEIVLVPASGSRLFDSTAFGSQVTDELKTYPRDSLAAPLNERTANFSWTSETLPAGAVALLVRGGGQQEYSRDRFAELINVEVLTPLTALLALLLAAGLGALHALSPGHGKTVVGAYLVGSKGTPRHAAFLGLTVTITHTAGVIALGVVTLFASRYVLPERLLPALSLVSGAIVLVMGLSLFVSRLRAAVTRSAVFHSHDEHVLTAHHHSQDHDHDQTATSPLTHSHGGRTHTHLPPGAQGDRITWRSLLALGISGGLLPCPSALVVMLSAISLHRVGYGLVLVVAFSAGLAATLTTIGLLFLYAGRLFKQSLRASRITRVLPVISALAIACVGGAICYEAFVQTGLHLASMLNSLSGLNVAALASTQGDGSLTSMGGLAVLALGLVFGLKHATEVDHIVAVSTMVSEHRNIRRSAVVGGLWGLGHTASLIIVGVIVLAFRIAIPDISGWLEFAVALMIIGLGVNAFVQVLLRRSDVHVHRHHHGGLLHAHTHFHEPDGEHSKDIEPAVALRFADHSHVVSRIGFKPLLVGAMHGLAGSGALTLLVLTQINSALVGLTYLAVFGVGSIVGMVCMSFLVGLPFAFSARGLGGIHHGLQTAAAALSISFGLWYA